MLNLKKLFRRTRNVVKKSAYLLPASLSPVSAFAADDALTEGLQNITEWITSGPATAIIMLAIVGAGYLWMFKGILSKSVAISIMGGSGFIYGAAFIADMLGA